MTAFIEVQGAEVTFPTRKGPFQALQGVDLQIHKGEFVTLIGHSGCGKSTLLNQITGIDAGLILTNNATASLGDKVWIDLPGGTANVQDAGVPGLAGVKELALVGQLIEIDMEVHK